MDNNQSVLLDLLQKTISIFDENNIWYSLACGSVLGAVREGGFIPWDSDIDIFVKITDISRIQSIFSDEMDGLVLVSYKKDTTSSHDKISMKGYDHTKIHIDLYPLIGMPNSENHGRVFIKKCHYLNKLLACKYENVNTVRNKYKAKIFTLINYLEQFVSDDFLRRIISRLETKYPFETSNKLSYIANDGHYREAINRDILLETKETYFEGIRVKIPLNYTFYLEQVYGKDYMIPKKY